MKHAFIDTNALLTLANQSRLFENIASQLPTYTPAIVEGVRIELQQLAIGSSKDARAAKLALDILNKQDLKTFTNSTQYVDAALIAVASAQDAIITLDKALQKEAATNGIAVFTIARKRLRQVA
ncbi:MAG: hypothetical protein ACMXYD_03075 [Candidatus Woesearchaeota archaeon]